MSYLLRWSLVVIFLLSWSMGALAQKLYSSHGYDIFTTDRSAACTEVVEHVYVDFVINSAIGPDNHLYFTTFDELGVYRPSEGTSEELVDYSTTGIDYWPYGSGCDAEGWMYMGAYGLQRYHVFTGVFDTLGLLPDSGWIGDITFYKGQFLLFGTSRKDTVPRVYHLDLNDLSAPLDVKFPQFSTKEFISGATTVGTDCDSAVIYLQTQNADGGALTPSELFTYDYETNTVTYVCTMDPQLSLFDLASELSYIHSNCILTVDLDIDNSSGYIVGDYGDTTHCGPVEVAVADEDTDVFAQSGVVDSVQVWSSGVIDAGDEGIDWLGGVPGIGLQRYSPIRLTLTNLGGVARHRDFEQAVKALRYRHDQIDYTPGIREIYFRAYSGGSGGDTSTMYVFLEPQTRVVSIADDTLTYCVSSDQLDIDTVVDRLGGAWLDASTVVDLSTVGHTTLTYVVRDTSRCISTDTSHVFVEVVAAAEVALGSDTALCVVSSYVISATGDYDSLRWSTGVTGQQISVDDFGVYWVEASYSGLCAVRDTITLLPSDERLIIERDTGVCQEKRIVIGTREYSVGDTAEQLMTNMEGCDTLLRYLVYGLMTPSALVYDTGVCEGVELIYEGEPFGIGDTIYDVRSVAGLGCDTPVLWIVGLHTAMDTIIERDTGCAEEVRVWQGLQIDQAGFYEVLDTSRGCGVLHQLYYDQYPAHAFSIISDPTVVRSGDTIHHEVSGDVLALIDAHWMSEGLLIDRAQLRLSEVVTTSGTVRWIATDSSGCQTTLASSYVVESMTDLFFIPTAFSPNNDGINDVFKPEYATDARISHRIEVYNRWGGLVFSGGTSRGREVWDGRSNGEEQPVDAYIYVITFERDGVVIDRQQGTVLLLR